MKLLLVIFLIAVPAVAVYYALEWVAPTSTPPVSASPPAPAATAAGRA
ncbi:MAG: hypothetical protein KGJ55_01325 [Gammaproteobacteria bacterium]|nr:hypothetical protein [Gammaproteobacteria bacterium]